ncbi:hypothetical protein CBR_g37940 [Chara braunii]|uniref:Uncharacterized protein n=1 Tax=Chara braunii TaxID=69332 RepID=A0A388LPB3_CHABU|nr:hypothetical protein CBR_g37940 [Chara braunii]|eukprot:GBG84065.1 hypothetical protein CBR_g37940 [Chara braunii]
MAPALSGLRYVLNIKVGELVTGLNVTDRQGTYLSFDVPQYTSAIWVFVNRTYTSTVSQLSFQARQGTLPTFKGFDGAMYQINGPTAGDLSMTDKTPEIYYSFVRRNPESGRHYMAVVHKEILNGEFCNSTFSLLVNIDACGPHIMANPYYFPPHHDEDIFFATRKRPACVPCGIEVPLVKGELSTNQTVYKVIDASSDSGRYPRESYYRIHVPRFTQKMTLRVITQSTEDVAAGAQIYLRQGNIPIHVSLGFTAGGAGDGIGWVGVCCLGKKRGGVWGDLDMQPHA